MKISKNLVSISLCALLLSACATKETVSLPEKVQKEITSTEVYIEECDKKMKADIKSSNITSQTGGGLLFALIDCTVMSHRESCAEDALVCVQKETASFDFQQKFSRRIERALRNKNWLHVQKVNHINGLNDEKHQEIFKNTSTDCVLTSKFFYQMNPELSVLSGILYVSLYPTGEKLKKIVNATNPLETPIFKFNVSSTYSLPLSNKDIEANAKLWVQNDGVLLKQALENIFNQVFDKMEIVLNAPNHLPEV